MENSEENMISDTSHSLLYILCYICYAHTSLLRFVYGLMHNHVTEGLPVMVTFKSVDEILLCNNSNENLLDRSFE